MENDNDVSSIIEAILVAVPKKQFTIIVVGNGEVEAESDAEDIMEPDDQDSVTDEADDFMEAFYAAVFGGETRQVAGGGGGGSPLDAIMQGTLTP